MSESPGPADVVSFWRAAGSEKWFKRDDAFDAALRERFGALHREAVAGLMDDWAREPEGALALILVLDQLSRNLLRGSPDAFASDARARAIARSSLAAGLDRAVDPALRLFFYMPLMHSESIADQERCVAEIHCLQGADGMKHALEHAEIIRRFGRFPHRNAVLGRHTTPAEAAFLAAGGFAG